MVMGSKQILDLAAGQGSGTGRGAALFHQRQRANGGSAHTPAQRQFLADLTARSSEPPASVTHPAKGVRTMVRGDEALSPSEVAWLQRFPSPVDPSAVSFEDAQHLAALSASISKQTHPGDAKLVESIWAPVREYHDRREADAASENASRPLPIIPSSVVGALHDAVSSETPDLHPHEVAGRVDAMLSDLHAKRSKVHADRQAKAEETHRQLDGKVVSRTLVNG